MTRYDVEKEKWNEYADQERDKYRRKSGTYAINENYEEVFARYRSLRPVVDHFALTDRTKTVLDIGCGSGWTTKLLAQNAARTVGVDISFESARLFASIIDFNRLDTTHALVCDSEVLPFKEGVFDCVFGHAVLHHLNLNAVLASVGRLLKENGRAAFAEPFAHNPLTNFYRHVKHNLLLKHKGTDRPLTYADRRVFERHFRRVHFQETAIFSNTAPLIAPLDAKLLDALPCSRRFASYVCILVEK